MNSMSPSAPSLGLQGADCAPCSDHPPHQLLLVCKLHPCWNSHHAGARLLWLPPWGKYLSRDSIQYLVFIVFWLPHSHFGKQTCGCNQMTFDPFTFTTSQLLMVKWETIFRISRYEWGHYKCSPHHNLCWCHLSLLIWKRLLTPWLCSSIMLWNFNLNKLGQRYELVIHCHLVEKTTLNYSTTLLSNFSFSKILGLRDGISFLSWLKQL